MAWRSNSEVQVLLKCGCIVSPKGALKTLGGPWRQACDIHDGWFEIKRTANWNDILTWIGQQYPDMVSNSGDDDAFDATKADRIRRIRRIRGDGGRGGGQQTLF